MTADIAQINEFFNKRAIKLKPEWLSALEKCLKTAQKPMETRLRIIFDQWLRVDIKQSTVPQFEKPGIAVLKDTVFQIVDILDISTPVYDQVTKNRDRDLDIETLDENIEYQPKVKQTRMFRMTLTDGATKVTGVEHEVIPGLTGAVPGCKIIICGRVRILNDILMLTPLNCQVIGGCEVKKWTPSSEK